MKWTLMAREVVSVRPLPNLKVSVANSVFTLLSNPMGESTSWLEGLGHILRMDQTKMAKKNFVNKPEGRRRVGRPRLKRLEDVENDLRVVEPKVKRLMQIEKNGHLL
jgi:hypothetical protein